MARGVPNGEKADLGLIFVYYFSFYLNMEQIACRSSLLEVINQPNNLAGQARVDKQSN